MGVSTGTGEEFRSHVAASFWRRRGNSDARPRENARTEEGAVSMQGGGGGGGGQ